MRVAAFQTDVDLDFAADRRAEVKAHLEEKYDKDGSLRVFAAGTFTTEKIRSSIKDVARTYKISVGTVEYLTKIIDDGASWTDVMRLVASDKRIRDFIEKHPEVFEDILPIMGQARSAGIHASAYIIVPEHIHGEKVDCFDLLPIRKMDDQLVSEISGYDIDEIGILKNDILGIQELTRLSDMFDLIEKQYNVRYTLLQIASQYLNDPKVFEIVRRGDTQGVFQLSEAGMTRFIKRMKPDNINDLIAAVALFRPGPLDSGTAEGYVQAKRGEYEPTFLWGTQDILKETFGGMVYQEQLSMVARKVGSLSLGDGVNLVKALSKKKLDKVRKFKDKFFEGAKANGCPKEAADKIWSDIEDAAKYSFNKCISGKEYIMRTNKHQAVSIEEMYNIVHNCAWAKAHNKMPLRSRYLKFGYGAAWSLCSDGKLRKNKIVDIRYEGKRPLYRITLENGKTLDVTENHKHPTSNGTKRTDELLPGIDMMYCYLGHIQRDTTYRFTDKGKTNNQNYHSNDNVENYELNSRKGHEGFYSRDTNFTKLQYYCEHLKKGYCEKCGKTGGRLEVHHINGDHSDCGENYSNLQTLCPSCHKKAHYRMGRVKMGESGIDTELSMVVSVEYLGDEDVYDVEMASPLHTFVSGNGVVTCNSHATAYGLTAYVGAWLKTYYPTPFYTVVLRDQDEKKMSVLLSEIRASGVTEVVKPNINVSGVNFIADYKKNCIYWSISRIKQLGLKAVNAIVNEREMFGEFYDMEDFIRRIFRKKFNAKTKTDDGETVIENTKSTVNTRHLKHLIMAGAFDEIENIKAVTERYGLLQKAAAMLKFELPEKVFPEELLDKQYFWAKKQVEVSGFGAIDYERLANNSDMPDTTKRNNSFIDLKELEDMYLMKKRGIACATITDVEEKHYKDKTTGERKNFGKITLQQNIDTAILTLWSDVWEDVKHVFYKSTGKILVCVAQIKWSDYDEKNNLQLNKGAFYQII